MRVSQLKLNCERFIKQSGSEQQLLDQYLQIRKKWNTKTTFKIGT